MTSQVAQVVKSPPVMQEVEEIKIQSLGWEDTLEEEMATHSSFLVWKIPRTEEPGGLQSIESQRVRQDLVTDHTCTWHTTAYIRYTSSELYIYQVSNDLPCLLTLLDSYTDEPCYHNTYVNF